MPHLLIEGLRKMNVLLISPRFPESFWGFNHALYFAGKKSVLPPLGLLTVAAMLPGDWGKRLVDLNVLEEISDADLAWANVVFVGGMGVQWKSATEVVARAKAANKTIVAGGPLFTSTHALFPEVDHFILNEAELMMPALLADLQASRAKRLYRTRDFADMTRSPVPLWNLLDLSAYACVGVQYSRGCPFDCDFCNVTAMHGRKPRIKTPSQIIVELDALYACGYRGRIFFVDDNLVGNRRALHDLLPPLTDWQRRHGMFPMCTQASINLADDESLTAGLVQAGFDAVFVGIETSDEASLTECSKKQNVNRDLIDDIRTLQRAGLEVQAGFIIGFDNDDDGTSRRQFEFIQRSGIVIAMAGQLQAPPGTRLLTRLRSEGRVLGPSSGDNTDGSTNVVAKMGVERLRAAHAWLLSRLYEPKACYARIRRLLQELPSRPPQRTRPVSRPGALFRALSRLGLTSVERVEFWKLLIWTLRNKPALTAIAIRLACYVHHHRRMSEMLAARVVSGDVPAGLHPDVISIMARARANRDMPTPVAELV
jgi:radical SAM superfamily enzyme YgiQ (UPF0313 family)